MTRRLLLGGFRLLLHLLPGDLRRAFGPAMEADLEARLEEARGREVLREGVVAWGDVVRQAAGLAWERVTGNRVEGGGTSDHWNGTRRGGGMMTGLGKDVVRAVRGLVRAPGFTLSAALTLALGIGMTAAVFSVVNAVLLRPLPYSEPDRLVSVWPDENFNVAMARRVAEEVESFEAMSGISVWGMSLTGDGATPLSLEVALVSEDHFRVLGIRPLVGRDFRAGEGITGSDGVVILSHDLWVSRFGADPGIVGRTIQLGGAGHLYREVIGVMPPGVVPVTTRPVQGWVPLATEAGVALGADNTWYVNWRVARLRPGVTREAAEAELQAVASRIREEIPASLEADTPVRLVPLREAAVGESARLLWVLLGAVGLVLLIACLNVANLVAAREERRARERAVRRALGASRWVLVRGALVEGGILALLGAIPAVVLAVGVVRWVAGNAADVLPRGTEIGVDGGVLLGIAAAAGVAILVTGIFPAFRTPAPASALSGSRTTGPRRHTVRNVLVATELALSLVLLTGAGLLIRSMGNLLEVDPGFRAENLVTLRPNVPEQAMGGAEGIRSYFQEVEARLAALPGVTSVGGIQLLPVTYGNWSFPMHIDGNPVAEGTPPPSVNIRIVSPGYFETMEIPLVSGRYPGEEDREGAAPAVAVNQAFVDRFWGGEPPAGRGLRMFSPGSTFREAVGVVADVRQQSLDIPSRPEVYIPLEQYPYGAVSLHLVARTAVPAATLLEEVREAVWSVDPDVPVVQLATMEEVLRDSLGRTRLVLSLLGVFALAALALAGVGVYGVTAYLVQRRRREFGLRMALGASESGVVRQAWSRGSRAILLGAAAGVALSLAGSRLLSGTLYGVEPGDPATLAAVTLLLSGLAGAASLIPAWRAARMDPARVLREE